MEKKNHLLFIIALLFVASFTLWGCGSQQPAQKQPGPQDVKKQLTIAAAADLAVAFKEIGQNFEKSTGNRVEFSFGSTGLLVQQIENGAPFDALAAANVKFVDDLNAKGKIVSDTKQLYARGRIGLLTLKGKPYTVKELSELTAPAIKKIAIANPEHAPYGLAAKQALEKAGFWDKIKEKLVYGNNIQDTLNLVQTGNAEVGIIALSLAKRDDVEFSLIDGTLHAPLDQAMAVVKGTPNEALAHRFIQYVNGPEGRVIMKKYGFVLPSEL
jgi:molybdate transport system substrate-binding protein